MSDQVALFDVAGPLDMPRQIPCPTCPADRYHPCTDDAGNEVDDHQARTNAANDTPF